MEFHRRNRLDLVHKKVLPPSPARYNTAMPHEIEVKYKAADHSKVRGALRAAGAEYEATLLQRDCYYDTPQLALLDRDCGLRIRTVRCLRRGKGRVDTRALLTAKGPARAGSSAKIRQEVQARLDDADAVSDVLKAFGLEPTLIIEKRRATYHLGRCRVELDQLPIIGCFVEIEAPSQRHIAKVSKQLGLTGEAIADHYVNLVSAACEKAARRCKSVTFDGCGRKCPAR